VYFIKTFGIFFSLVQPKRVRLSQTLNLRLQLLDKCVVHVRLTRQVAIIAAPPFFPVRIGAFPAIFLAKLMDTSILWRLGGGGLVTKN
jgi:hypothetical protein